MERNSGITEKLAPKEAQLKVRDFHHPHNVLASEVAVEPVMFKLGPDSMRALCDKEDMKGDTFAAQYGMYFHTQDFGAFYLNFGRVSLEYPFTK